MSFQEKIKLSASEKRQLDRQQFIDAVILQQEADRILGWDYPEGDLRNKYLHVDTGKRVEYLRDLFVKDMVRNQPEYYNWHKGKTRAIEDALLIQENLMDKCGDLIEHLTYLNYPILESKRSTHER
jgi:hypothetical protein